MTCSGMHQWSLENSERKISIILDQFIILSHQSCLDLWLYLNRKTIEFHVPFCWKLCDLDKD